MSEYPQRPILNVQNPEVNYVPRPGAYGLVLNKQGQILLIKEESGFFLPGGGQDAGETMFQALKREFQEELQADVINAWPLMAADDCRWSPVYQQHFQIQGHYYWVDLDPSQTLLPEPGASLHWLNLEQGVKCLTRKNEQWIVKQLLGDCQLLPNWKPNTAESISQLCSKAFYLEAQRINHDSFMKTTALDIAESSDSFWGFFKQNSLVALISADLNEFPIQITRLVVDPEMEGQGLGTQLLTELLGLFSGLQVQAYCAQGNERALQLYLRKGFGISSSETEGSDVPYLVLNTAAQ